MGLHGDRDVSVEFDSPVKIIINENGAGKTTVLNALYYTLSCNWHKLSQVSFDTITLTFNDGRDAVVKADAFYNRNDDLIEVAQYLQNKMHPMEYQELVEYINISSAPTTSRRVSDVSERYRIPVENIVESLRFRRLRRRSSGFSKELEETGRVIHSAFPYQILYFPTYRRVEEDLQSLGYVEKSLQRNETLIQFGMDDVKQRFERITSEIRDSSVEWYSRISGKMLSELADGTQIEQISYDKIQNPDTLRIVMDRIGENISTNTKDHILELLRTSGIKMPMYAPLAYFLTNLIEVYDQQKNNDNSIKNFAKVCNGYFVDKEVRYNESKVDISVVDKRTGNDVALDKLSSGEKQVLSIFSRIYLEKINQYAVIFDEPELSLSLEWQRKLLQDITDSSNCVFLFAATHSPFIFENELDRYASSLSIIIRR